MHDQLLGSTQPVLSISLEPGESIVAEAGAFAWMTDSIQLTPRAADLSDYTAKDQAGTIAFASRLPGSILHIDVAPGQEYLVQRNGFLAGTPGVVVTTAVQQTLPATEGSGDTFILQRISGRGRAWVQLSGDVIRRDLAAGASLRTHLWHIGMADAAVAVQMAELVRPAASYPGTVVQRLAVLSGPGAVWLQSMPLLAVPSTPIAERDARARSYQEQGKQEHDS